MKSGSCHSDTNDIINETRSHPFILSKTKVIVSFWGNRDVKQNNRTKGKKMFS